MPDALEMSPRLRQHLELVRRHLLALRDALALAYALGRILVLPRLPCLCDRSEGPLVLRECKYEASELPTPFVCPLTHIIDIVRFASISPDMVRGRALPGQGCSYSLRAYLPIGLVTLVRHASVLTVALSPPSRWCALQATAHMPHRPGAASVTFRESSFLANPLTPVHARKKNATVVKIVPDSAAMREAQARGEAALLLGTSDEQARAALGGGSPYAPGLVRASDAAVLHLTSAEGVFGGFVEVNARAAFEEMIGRSAMLFGSWCCSSWYKPSGSIEYVAPQPTLSLPQGCGVASPLTANGSQAALDHPNPQLRRACAEQQQARLAQARGPTALEYRLKRGREGRDGYYEHVL